MKTKLTHGVGFNSKRKHKTRVDGKNTRAYQVWYNMIRRCYCPDYQKRNPTYIGCTVDECWHDFQNFADWFYSQPYGDKGYELDKDILTPSNKTYSPDTCCLIPQVINSLLLDGANARGRHPQGVDFHKPSGSYRSRLKIKGKHKHLGYFACPVEAYQSYKTAKERHVKNMALEWANRIEWNVFVALMVWSL